MPVVAAGPEWGSAGGVGAGEARVGVGPVRDSRVASGAGTVVGGGRAAPRQAPRGRVGVWGRSTGAISSRGTAAEGTASGRVGPFEAIGVGCPTSAVDQGGWGGGASTAVAAEPGSAWRAGPGRPGRFRGGRGCRPCPGGARAVGELRGRRAQGGVKGRGGGPAIGFRGGPVGGVWGARPRAGGAAETGRCGPQGRWRTCPSEGHGGVRELAVASDAQGLEQLAGRAEAVLGALGQAAARARARGSGRAGPPRRRRAAGACSCASRGCREGSCPGRAPSPVKSS